MTRYFGAATIVLLLTLGVSVPAVHAAEPPDQLPFVDENALNDKIPTLHSVLGYEWADEIASHVEVERYLQTLAEAAPERTQLVRYGESYERRGLHYLVISSAENMKRIEDIRTSNLQLADPRGADAQTLARICQENPAIVWLAYSVHGNECSPTDAALLTAYHLLADQRQRTRKLLDELVVVIDPLQNPDGRERFVHHFRKSRGSHLDAMPLASEHSEPWPGGRTNHYWFDMNRDWFLQSQQETVAKVEAYLHWQPQVYVDAHEMGRNRTYYFSPPTDPVNPFMEAKQSEWLTRIGRHQAKRFDEHGFRYTTREMFDAFYPGYGSEWPTLRGGLGILWEQAGVRGLLVDRDDDTTLHYDDCVRHHYVSGLATIEITAQHRQRLLQDFLETQRRSLQLGDDGPVREFFLLAEGRPHRTRRMAQLLTDNGIEVEVVTKPVTVSVRDIRGGPQRDRQIPRGSYRIVISQPGGRLARVLLDRKVEMEEEFVQRQMRRKDLYMPDEIYDVTAWSLPLAFGVTCLASEEATDLDCEPMAKPVGRDDFPTNVPQVAYLIPGTDGAMFALCALLQQDVRVHVLDRPTKLNGKRFDRGTLVVFTRDNPKEVGNLLRQQAAKYGLQVFAADTGFVDEGAHLGGPYVQWIEPPRVLLPVDRPMSYRVGHTWHLFDQRLQYPTTRVATRYLPSVEMEDYNVLVLPDGSYSEKYGFDDPFVQKVKQWVRRGGTLIVVRGAVQWALGEDIGLLPGKRLQKRIEPKETSGTKQQAESEDKPTMVSPDYVPGVFLRASVFEDHWVTYSCRKEMDVFYSGSLILQPLLPTDGRSLVTFAERENLLTSGFCWPNNLELLSESPYVSYQREGSGHIIGFTDDPNYRAMYPDLQRLFINAVLFGPAH